MTTFVNEGDVFAHFPYIHIIEYLRRKMVSFVQQVPDFSLLKNHLIALSGGFLS